MVSVVIPLYNKEKTVGNTIECVLNQSFGSFEVIIVNDGSTDGSLYEIKRFRDPRIKIIDKENEGVSIARNVGVQAAKYQLIALLDADDVWENTFLEQMHALCFDFPDAIIYGCSWAFRTDSGVSMQQNYGVPENHRGYIDNYFDINNYNTLFNSSSVVFKKDSFVEIGEFDPFLKIGEDIDLWFRFALKGKVAYINKLLSYYVIDSANRVSLKKNEPETLLVANLKKFKYHEMTNPDFKRFLDTWRYHYIIDHLSGRRRELKSVKFLLAEMHLNRFHRFLSILKFVPSWLDRRSYYLYKTMQKIKKAL